MRPDDPAPLPDRSCGSPAASLAASGDSTPGPLARQVIELEQRSHNRSRALDGMLDFYNDLVDWTTDTPHESAAKEIGELIETHLRLNTSLHSLVSERTQDAPVAG